MKPQHDVALPQLGTVLDPAAMGPILAERLWATGAAASRFELAGCSIERVRYRPGRSCMVSYRLAIDDVRTGERAPHLLTARVYPPDESPQRFAKSVSRGPVRFGPGLLHISALGLIGWGFPQDRKLVHLPLFADDARLRIEALPEVVAAGWGDRARIVEARSRLVHYVPEQGCTVRIDVVLDTAAGPRTAAVYGKTYPDADGARHAGAALVRIAAHMSALRARGAAGIPAVPRLLAVQRRHAAIWTEAIAGAPLGSGLARGTLAADWPAMVAFALAALHDVPTCGPAHAAQPAERLARAVQVIAAALPDAQPRLARLQDALSPLVAAVAPDACIHGDLHAQNVLCAHGAIGLVDFDALCRGPAALDLGSFLAAEAQARMLDPARGGPIDALAATLTEAYRGARAAIDPHAALPDGRAVFGFLAYGLLAERAYRAVTRMKTGRLALVRRLLAAAEDALARAGRPR